MAFRKVDGVFWTDPKVRALTEQERYLFLYLITCPTAHSSGIYYNPLPMISYETGINEKALVKALGSLREGSMVYCGSLSGVVFVKNMLKFQKPNANEKSNIEKHLKTIQDKELLVMFLDVYPEYWEGFDKASVSLREGLDKDIHTKTKTKTDTKTEIETDKQPQKKQGYGLKGKVKMLESEYDKLVEKYGKENVDSKILDMEAYRDLHKYTDHYLTINKWLLKDVGEKNKRYKEVWDDKTGKVIEVEV